MPRTLPLSPVPRALGERCCDPEAISRLAPNDAERAAAAMEILSNPVRLQLLDVLARNEGRVCVCDLEAVAPVKQPTVSHHLRLLREAGLIEREKVGLWAYYRINRPAVADLRQRIAGTLTLFT